MNCLVVVVLVSLANFVGLEPASAPFINAAVHPLKPPSQRGETTILAAPCKPPSRTSGVCKVAAGSPPELAGTWGPLTRDELPMHHAPALISSSLPLFHSNPQLGPGSLFSPVLFALLFPRLLPFSTLHTASARNTHAGFDGVARQKEFGSSSFTRTPGCCEVKRTTQPSATDTCQGTQ
jgi:hypothetical protein